MAKDKSLKSDTHLPKRKKLSSVPKDVHAEEMMDTKVKKKKMEVEEAPVQIPHETQEITADDIKQKKKKHKKKLKAEQTQEAPVQIPHETQEITADDTKQKKEKKHKKKLKTEQTQEAPVQIPHETQEITADDTKQKKEKKDKKKLKTEQTQISDPPCHPEKTCEAVGEEDLSPEERRVLERKMKKILKKEEKKRLKAQGETVQKTEAPGPTAPQQALEYLTCWAENRSEWKFQKTRQTWLLQHMFDSEKIPDEKFALLLQYLEGLRGGARDTTVKKALVLVEESGQVPEDKVAQQRAHRAREVIQMLS